MANLDLGPRWFAVGADPTSDQRRAAAAGPALVVIDMTNFDAHPGYGFDAFMHRQGFDDSGFWPWLDEIVVPNNARLLDAWRARGARVAFARVGGQLADCADSNGHIRFAHRECGSIRGTETFEVRSELEPRLGEIVVDKPGMGAFTTTNLDLLLRNARVTSIVMTGVGTNACVLMSALGAFDLGYDVTVVADACATWTRKWHDAALELMHSLGVTIATTEEILASLPIDDQSSV
jgi:biuret amidohydrolase